MNNKIENAAIKNILTANQYGFKGTEYSPCQPQNTFRTFLTSSDLLRPARIYDMYYFYSHFIEALK